MIIKSRSCLTFKDGRSLLPAMDMAMTLIIIPLRRGRMEIMGCHLLDKPLTTCNGCNLELGSMGQLTMEDDGIKEFSIQAFHK